MALCAALARAGFDARIAIAAREGIAGMRRSIEEHRPAVIGYSAMTGEHFRLLDLNRALKKDYDFTSVFGGPHPTFFPALIDEPGVDAVCRGEGDAAFVEFCRRLADGKAHHRTPNFIVRRRGGTIENPMAPAVDDLDSLPFADRGAMYRAEPGLRRKPHRIFFAGRGCPYDCAYCFNRRYNELYRGLGRRLRLRSAGNLVDEIVEVRRRFGLSLAWIDDDVFPVMDGRWFGAFCAEYPRRAGLPFMCNVRADLLDRGTVRSLRDAGLMCAVMGVECADEDVSRRILHRKISADRMRESARLLKDAGVTVVTQNMVGLPVPDPYAVDLKTLDFNIGIEPDFSIASILYPYPATRIEAYAREHGFLAEGTEFRETNKRGSMLTFSSPAVKRRVENLHKIFAIIVRFPTLRPLCDALCNLPADRLYAALFWLWYGLNWKTKVHPFGSPLREMPGYLGLWWRMIRKN